MSHQTRIISPCLSGSVDPVVHNIIRDLDSKYPLVPVTKLDDFLFNRRLYELDEYILIDFCEYGWNWDMKETHLFGENTKDFAIFSDDEWKEFENFVTVHPPLLYFKRELLTGEQSENVRPIEYPACREIPEPQTKEEFSKRLFEVNFIWGLSHEYRKTLHGEIWKQSGNYGYAVCDNIPNINGFIANESNHKKWITANVPHYARFAMETISEINVRSKISVSLAGAGRKCFRHTEILNSAMFMWSDWIAWTFPWAHNFNCIKSEEGREVEAIIEALNNPDLYEIYLNGIENQKKYFLPSYQNYLENEINKL